MRNPIPFTEASAMLEAAGDQTPLPPEAVATLLNKKSVNSLEKMRHAGIGPRFIKIGGRVAYPAGEIRKYLAGLTRHQVA